MNCCNICCTFHFLFLQDRLFLKKSLSGTFQDAHFLSIYNLSVHCPCFYILTGLLYLMLGSFFVHFFYSHFYFTCAQTFYQVLFIDRYLSDVVFNTGFISICEVVECYHTMQDDIFTFYTWCRERHHYKLQCYKTSTHTHAVSTT